MGDIGPEKLLILLVVVLLVFGAKRLPEIGRGLGKGMKEFRESVKGLHDDVKGAVEAEPPAVERVHPAAAESRTEGAADPK